MTINLGQAKAWLTYLVGLGAAAYAAYGSVAHTANANWSAVLAAVLLGVERYVSDPSTGDPDATWAPTPTKTTAKPVAAPGAPPTVPATPPA